RRPRPRGAARPECAAARDPGGGWRLAVTWPDGTRQEARLAPGAVLVTTPTAPCRVHGVAEVPGPE
ncbi:hypothetical protein RKE29_28215, partial [Streptomyces sp. B1866]|uniref:hypothetical protein n=1 Tax=Streptomyces sp. B1866 TaxID=3075431 RepID=UPI0028922604